MDIPPNNDPLDCVVVVTVVVAIPLAPDEKNPTDPENAGVLDAPIVGEEPVPVLVKAEVELWKEDVVAKSPGAFEVAAACEL